MKINGEGQSAILSSEDQAKVLEAMKQFRAADRDRALLVLGLFTGLRRNELRLLDIGDVLDAEGGFKPTFQLKAKNTKSKQSRTVYLHQEAAKYLLEYLASRPDARDDEPLFIVPGGKRISISATSRVFERAFKAAGIQGASTHSMRRTFITRLHKAGTRIKVISRLAGHSSIAITDRYIEIGEDECKEAVLDL